MPEDQDNPHLLGLCGQPARLKRDGQGAKRAAHGEMGRVCKVRCGICGDGRRGQGKAHDTHYLRKREERASVDRRAEGEQPPEVEDTLPSGAYVRLYGADDGRAGIQSGRHGEGKSGHRTDRSGLQHLQTGPDQEISRRMDCVLMQTKPTDYPPSIKKYQQNDIKKFAISKTFCIFAPSK